MKRTRNLLKSTALALAIVGSAFAQDLNDYKWRADVNNHGWKIGTRGPVPMSRAQRFAPDKWVTISVNHVAQIDNLDKGDALGADDADFFAVIWVDGVAYKSKNFSEDDGNPNWTLRVPVTSDTHQIRIRLMDDDGGFEQRDDHVDINPAGGQKDLILTYNAATSQITGDLSGGAGAWLQASGDGDDDKGKISFQIR